MLKKKLILTLILLFTSESKADGNIGDECIPGKCTALNSNCKWSSDAFKCVCKEKYLAVNDTHCGQPINNIEENKCRLCLEKNALCLDYDENGSTDECWCPNDQNCGQKLLYKQENAISI
ncbi:hypothetical protein BpHYR1_030872 [Brachionus plicatilis]|uniref:EGF-like domain-containing protein n=1 Tax=Brachionus plicatilis TaxID=10195 RepID=A0A3M7QI16_BRAPC|nr:hypothetical protein BpHYR1_030872 [Brachionus plicatilis]